MTINRNAKRQKPLPLVFLGYYNEYPIGNVNPTNGWVYVNRSFYNKYVADTQTSVANITSFLEELGWGVTNNIQPMDIFNTHKFIGQYSLGYSLGSLKEFLNVYLKESKIKMQKLIIMDFDRPVSKK